MDHQGFGDEDDDAFGQLFGGEEGGPGDLVGDEGPVAAVFEPPQLLDEVVVPPELDTPANRALVEEYNLVTEYLNIAIRETRSEYWKTNPINMGKCTRNEASVKAIKKFAEGVKDMLSEAAEEPVLLPDRHLKALKYFDIEWPVWLPEAVAGDEQDGADQAGDAVAAANDNAAGEDEAGADGVGQAGDAMAADD